MLRKLLLGLTLCLAAGAIMADTPAPIPVEAFFSYSKISEVKISPDGKYLALVIADPKTGEDRKALVVMGSDDAHKIVASFLVSGYQIVDEFWWTLENRIIASTATTDTGFFDPPVRDGGLFAIN